jgi:hypothetical protein
MRSLVFAISLTFQTVADAQAPTSFAGDDAIRRVENCVCYKSIDSQNLKPWELAWKESGKLRKQISHCVCEAFIDIQRVENPLRYVVPGTAIK